MKEVLDRAPYAWTGEMPSHWRHARLGSCLRERHVATTAELAPALSVTKDGVVEQQDQVAKSQEGAPKKLVQPGDIVINSRSDRKGSAGIAPRLGSVSLINTVLEPTGVDAKFAYHILRSIPFQEEFFRHGSGIVDDLWTTRYAAMKSIQLPMPPEPEQRAIADYLDHETAEIDAFIADQENLRTLALERIASSRMRHFSHSPEQGPRLRQVARIVNGSGFPLEQQGDPSREIPFFKVGDLGKAERGYLSSTVNTVSRTTASKLRAQVLPPGTVIMAKIGAALYLNRNATLQRPSCVDNNMMGVVPGQTVTSEFLQQILLTKDLKPLGNPGAVPSLNIDWFKESRVWLPDSKTQTKVVREFGREKNEIDSLVADLERSQYFSRERRAALISAAVTGQIDVTKRHKPVAEVLEDEFRERV